MKALAALVAEIAAAYVRTHKIDPPELEKLLIDVYQLLANLQNGPEKGEPISQPRLKPAVPVRNSITTQNIVCLEDGKKFKSLRRHLLAEHGLSPSQYRKRWSLPSDYPMVAPDYSKKRSQLAVRFGLGRKRG